MNQQIQNKVQQCLQELSSIGRMAQQASQDIQQVSSMLQQSSMNQSMSSLPMQSSGQASYNPQQFEQTVKQYESGFNNTGFGGSQNYGTQGFGSSNASYNPQQFKETVSHYNQMQT